MTKESLTRAFEKTIDTYFNQKNKKRKKKGITILSGIHQLRAQNVLLETLLNACAESSNLHVFSKIYSQGNSSYIGGNVSYCPSSFNSHDDFDSQYMRNIQRYLDENTGSFHKDVLVIEDGGFITESLVERGLHHKHKVTVVEQTGSGSKKIQDLFLRQTNLPLRVFDAGSCDAKKEYELPYIAAVFIENLWRHIYTKRGVDFSESPALIIGNGALGKNIRRQLNRHSTAIDLKEYESPQNVEDEIIKATEKQKTIIIGYTGNTSISWRIHDKLQHCLFASASSSDREFDAVYMRRKTASTTNPHVDIRLGNYGILLNGGFPITFNGNAREMPDERTEPMLSMMLAIACRSFSKQYRPGVHRIDTDIQTEAIKKWKQLEY